MKKKEKERKKAYEMPVCAASSSCAEHARLWDDCDEPCDDGRAGIIHEIKAAGKDKEK